MPQYSDERAVKARKSQGAVFAMVLTLILAFPIPCAVSDQAGGTVSVKSKNTPLIDVLNSVSKTSGYSFILGDEWKNTPISVNFDQLPLDSALKRIMTNLNHVVIYEPKNTIRVNIYGASAPGGRATSLPARDVTPPPDMGTSQEEEQVPDREPEQEAPDQASGVDQKTAPDQTQPPSVPAEEPNAQKKENE